MNWKQKTIKKGHGRSREQRTEQRAVLSPEERERRRIIRSEQERLALMRHGKPPGWLPQT